MEIPSAETEGAWETWRKRADIRRLSRQRAIALIHQHYDSWIAFSEHPFVDPFKDTDPEEFSLSPRMKIPSETSLQLSMLGPTSLSFDLWNTYNREQAKLILLETTLALQAYRQSKGEFPKTLMQLVPQYLSETPTDPFSSDGLVSKVRFSYQRLGKGYLLYSYGPDFHDDKGKPLPKFSGIPTIRANGSPLSDSDSKGDIVVRYDGEKFAR